MNAHNAKLVIFDWDGTLYDSADRIVQSVFSAADEVGKPRPDAQRIRQVIGLGLDEAMKRAFDIQDIMEILKYTDVYKRHYHTTWAGHSALFNGVKALLDDLNAAGKIVTIATGKSRSGLEQAMQEQGVKHCFDYTITGPETVSKPDPTMLNMTLAEFDAQADEAVMIGDTSFDMEMAANIDMPRIGVNWGVHTDEEMLAHKPIGVMANIPALRAALLAD
jgi:phosphoglycolate phosphatase